MKKIRLKKAFLITMSLIVVLFSALFVVYHISYNETKELNDLARGQLQGSFIELSKGYTHYDFQGPEDGELVVLCHGAGPALQIWDKQMEALTGGGYRVLRYDRYGTGYSDRLKSGYSIDVFISQIAELLEALHIKEPVIFVGRSFGSKVVSAFAYKYPEKVSKVILTASGSFMFDYKKVPRFNLPFFKEFFIRVLSKPLMESYLSEYRRYAETEEEFENFKTALFDQLTYKGSEDAIKQILSYDVILAYPEAYQFLIEQSGKDNLDLYVIWGEEDKVLPRKKLAQIETTYPSVKAASIKGADHWLNYTHYREFNKVLLGYLNS